MQAEERKVNKVGTVVTHYATYSENQFFLCNMHVPNTLYLCHDQMVSLKMD